MELGKNKTRVMLVCFALIIATSVASAQEISVSPSSISRSLSSTTSVAVTVTNNLNTTVHIIVTKGGDLDLSISPSEFNLNPLSSRSITLTLNPGSYSGKLYYFWSYANDSGVVYQNINVLQTARVVVFPQSIDVNLIKNETLDYPVVISNPTAYSVTVNISGYGSVIAGVSDHDVSIPSKGFSSVYVTIKGLNGAGEVRYTIHYPSSTETITQSVSVYAYEPQAVKEYQDLKKQVDELKKEVEETKAKVYLPDKIRVQVSKGVVGKPITLTVTGMVNGKWVPLGGVVVSIGDTMGLTDSQGVAHISVNRAGSYDVKVYDRLGSVKYTQTISVQKGKIKLKIPEIKLGKPFRIDLPEEGELTIYKNKAKYMVLKADSDTNITLSEPGKYNFSFSSDSYYGSGEVVVRDKVKIVAFANKVQLKPGAMVSPGDVILITFKYTSGKPAKVDASYQFVPESGKVNKEKMFDVLMMQMLSSYYSESGTDIMLPTFGRASDTSTIQVVVPDEGGILTVKADGGDYADGASLMLRVTPSAPNPITTAVPFFIIGLTTSIFVYKASPRVRGVVNSKLKRIKGGGAEPPI